MSNVSTMKHAIAALVALVVIAAPVEAMEDKFVTDAPSSLRLRNTNGVGETHFSGKAAISGSFVALWEDPGSSSPPYLVVRFRPDVKSNPVLPYEKDRPVEDLWLSNTVKALALLVSPTVRSQLRTKRITRVEGDARIVITDYTTRVDCDVRRYFARILSASPSQRIVVASVPLPEMTC